MTSEPWLPVPYDPAPYECALDEPPSQTSSGLTAGGGSPSAPANPAATADAAPPAGALPLLEICPNCLIEVDEDFYCSGCGRLVIDRAARPSSEERPRGPEGDPC